MANVKKIDFDFDEWHSLIGRSIVACGDIELVSYKCLTYLPSEDIIEIVADLAFTKRIDLICKLIEDKPIPQEIKSDFIDLLAKAKKTAETRNIIAHNPLQVSVYEHEKSGDLFVCPEIQTIRKKNKILRLQDMREFTAKVEELSSDLQAVVGQVFAACNRKA